MSNNFHNYNSNAALLQRFDNATYFLANEHLLSRKSENEMKRQQ